MAEKLLMWAVNNFALHGTLRKQGVAHWLHEVDAVALAMCANGLVVACKGAEDIGWRAQIQTDEQLKAFVDLRAKFKVPPKTAINKKMFAKFDSVIGTLTREAALMAVQRANERKWDFLLDTGVRTIPPIKTEDRPLVEVCASQNFRYRGSQIKAGAAAKIRACDAAIPLNAGWMRLKCPERDLAKVEAGFVSDGFNGNLVTDGGAWLS